MVITSMRQRDEDEGERRDPRPDHPHENGPRGGDANQCRQPRFLVSACFSEKCHDRPAEERRHDVSQRTAEEREECMEDCHGVERTSTAPKGTQVRSIRSGMGVSIASDVKGPRPTGWQTVCNTIPSNTTNEIMVHWAARRHSQMIARRMTALLLRRRDDRGDPVVWPPRPDETTGRAPHGAS